MINFLYKKLNIPHTDLLINVISVQRCGTHAVSNWLLRQHKQIWHDSTPEHKGDYYEISSYYKRNVMFNGKPQTLKYVGDSDVALICYENVSVEDFVSSQDEIIWSIGRPLKTQNILVLRDFYNFSASFFKRHEYVPEHILKCWESIAKEVINRENKFKYFINYNKWHKDISYRKEVCKVLGLHFNDYGKQSILDFGGGSSFDGTLRDGEANSLDTEKRWTNFINNEAYKRIIRNNKKLTDMSDSIFGRVEGVECLW